MLIGFIRRGRLGNLGRAPLRHFYLFVLPFATFALAYAASRATGGDSYVTYIRAANIVQYLILLTAIGLNLHLYGMWLAGIGTFLNFLVLAVNGGVMPVSMKALQAARLTYLLEGEHSFIRHAIMTPETRLKAIADIIPVPGYGFIMPQVASIGDLLIAVAVFILIQRYMCVPASDAKASQAGG
jgi:hypothetical protein